MVEQRQSPYSRIATMSASTPSEGIALYMDALKPPTDRWPFNVFSPLSSQNFKKLSSSFDRSIKTKGIFIIDRSSLFTLDVNTINSLNVGQDPELERLEMTFDLDKLLPNEVIDNSSIQIYWIQNFLRYFLIINGKEYIR